MKKRGCKGSEAAGADITDEEQISRYLHMIAVKT